MKKIPLRIDYIEDINTINNKIIDKNEYELLKSEINIHHYHKNNMGINNINPYLDYILMKNKPLDDFTFFDSRTILNDIIDNIIYYDAMYIFDNPRIFIDNKLVNPSTIFKYLSLYGISKSIMLESETMLAYIMMNSNILCPHIYFTEDIEPLINSNDKKSYFMLQTLLINPYTINCMDKNINFKSKVLSNLLQNYVKYFDILVSIPWKIDVNVLRNMYKILPGVEILLNEFIDYIIYETDITEVDVIFMIENLLYSPTEKHIYHLYKINNPLWKNLVKIFKCDDNIISKYASKNDKEMLWFVLNNLKCKSGIYDFLYIDHIDDQRLASKLRNSILDGEIESYRRVTMH